MQKEPYFQMSSFMYSVPSDWRLKCNQ
uniref:Uncharacterized protein n=1 Tax=Anguilla anguilla TaxID=7936 RepID=A0A0E9TFU3_ANGAN